MRMPQPKFHLVDSDFEPEVDGLYFHVCGREVDEEMKAEFIPEIERALAEHPVSASQIIRNVRCGGIAKSKELELWRRGINTISWFPPTQNNALIADCRTRSRKSVSVLMMVEYLERVMDEVKKQHTDSIIRVSLVMAHLREMKLRRMPIDFIAVEGPLISIAVGVNPPIERIHCTWTLDVESPLFPYEMEREALFGDRI